MDKVERELYEQIKEQSALENREAFIKTMEENFNNQDDSYLGTFWYLPQENRLFLVQKASASDLRLNQNHQKTTSKLHVTIWQHEKNRAKSKGLSWKYGEDYTKIPRGRVWFSEEEGFLVTVGEWINEYPQAKELILDEFELPPTTQFKIDPHWNIGSGWSGDRV